MPYFATACLPDGIVDFPYIINFIMAVRVRFEPLAGL